MATSITDRLTAAIRLADQSIANAQYQADHRNWTEARLVMLAARDEINRPDRSLTDIVEPEAFIEPKRLDGRTKEARAAKASQ